jgi:dipeptidyl-peptidase-4
LHLVRYSLDDDTIVPLTEGDGNHSWEFSPDEKYLVARYSRVDLPPVTELRSMEDGKQVAVLAQADASQFVKAAGGLPRRFVAKGRDGQTDIYGMIVLPHDFEPESDKRYPVLELIYAGPHSAHVPKSFGRFIDLRKTADLGFIVVRIDGMGTSHRSKAFHDVCWKNLADAGFPDRIAWMRAAAEQIPQMDLQRVGIWGGSAGGQNAMRALIDHGDFYKAAFADCGCHDNRMDKIWWNELWMGWPIGPHYEQQSNVTGAHKVTGKLMLSVGELDRNVDPASTLQVVNALIKADKDFELLLIPGAGHGAGSSPYGDRRRVDFFVRHLWNTQPRQ